MENQIFIAMANRAGQGTGLTFAGESAIVDPLGNIVVQCDRSEQICHADVDLSLLKSSRQNYCYTNDSKIRLTGHQIEHKNGTKEWIFEK
jgi:(R)-amidase